MLITCIAVVIVGFMLDREDEAGACAVDTRHDAMNFLMLPNATGRLRRVVTVVRAVLGEGRQWQMGCRPSGGGDRCAASGDQDGADNGDANLAMEQRGQLREHTPNPF